MQAVAVSACELRYQLDSVAGGLSVHDVYERLLREIQAHCYLAVLSGEDGLIKGLAAIFREPLILHFFKLAAVPELCEHFVELASQLCRTLCALPKAEMRGVFFEHGLQSCDIVNAVEYGAYGRFICYESIYLVILQSRHKVSRRIKVKVLAVGEFFKRHGLKARTGEYAEALAVVIGIRWLCRCGSAAVSLSCAHCEDYAAVIYRHREVYAFLSFLRNGERCCYNIVCI